MGSNEYTTTMTGTVITKDDVIRRNNFIVINREGAPGLSNSKNKKV